MIQNNQELETTLERIEHFQKIVEKLKVFETNSRNYKLSAGGFLAEIDRMNLEVLHYLIRNIYMPVTSENNMFVDSPQSSTSNFSWEISCNNVRLDPVYIRAPNFSSETFSPLVGLTHAALL